MMSVSAANLRHLRVIFFKQTDAHNGFQIPHPDVILHPKRHPQAIFLNLAKKLTGPYYILTS